LNPLREKAMEKSKSESNFWPLAAAAVAIVIILAAIHWSLGHPYGVHWDEGEYINDVRIDLQRLQTFRVITLGRRILVDSYDRPPAYRLLAFPFLLPFGYHATLARLSSLTCFGLAACFIYLAMRRIAGRTASALAVFVFILSPEVISASRFFSTDAPVFLATAALFFYLFVSWTDATPRTSTWIGLGLAIGLGLWSKTSFLLVAPPALAFALFASFRKHRSLRDLVPIVEAGVLGVALAAPWWLVNFRHAMGYAQFARNTVRNSLGPLSPVMLRQWSASIFQGLLGHGIGILIALLAIAWFAKAIIGKETLLNPLHRNVLGACACAGLPLVLAQLTSSNDLLRYLTPAIIPLAIVAGVLADSTGWVRSKTAMAVSSFLIFGQLGMLLYPVAFPNKELVEMGLVNGGLPWQVLTRYDQWDLKPLREISESCGLEAPKISFLGGARPLYPPQIEYPWVAALTSTRLKDINLPPDPVWLWRYEDGPLDWQKVMDAAGQSDMVLTMPGYVGETVYKEDVDNEHNEEFAKRLSHDPRFQGPIRLEMGRFTPTEILVFPKKSLACKSQPGS
jgi:hypothetical protein